MAGLIRPHSKSIATKQPTRRARVEVAYAVDRLGGNEHFVAGAHDHNLSLNFQFKLSLNNGDQFIEIMSESFPPLARRIGKGAAIIAASRPISGDGVLVNREWKLTHMKRVLGHWDCSISVAERMAPELAALF